MLDIKIIRENPEQVKDNIKKRNLSLDLDKFLEIDKQKLDLIIKVDELRAIRNKVSKEIPTMMNEERPSKIAKMKKLWDELGILEEKQKKVEESWKDMYYRIPNLLDETAAIWNTDEDNIVDSTFLEPTKFDFEPKHHADIWEAKWWIDLEKWAEVSWSRFWYLKGDIVLLQFAIINFAMAKLVAKWFSPVLPPVLTKQKAMFWTWYFPAEEDGLYHVNPDNDDIYLIGTSEVPVTSYHAWETLDLEKPIMYSAYSSCFRREAWSAWKDMRGILRWHQFDKVEMVVFCKAEQSQKMHDFMVETEEEVWQELGIPYNKMNVCSWDLWNPAMKKFDLEAWMPGQQKFREVTSCSNIWEYQTRRLWIKYKDENWKSQYAHTLNWTIVALSRCLIAIIENYQTKDGDVKIPDVLKPFMWGKEMI